MDRREFIKGAAAVTAVMASSYSFAGDNDDDIKRLVNRENPTALEQKHVPGVDVPESVSGDQWFDVKVKVGFMVEHPSMPEHWITMIKLVVNSTEVAKTTFKKGGIARPEALFRIKLIKTATLKVIENCNIHGTWISDPVVVKVV